MEDGEVRSDDDEKLEEEEEEKEEKKRSRRRRTKGGVWKKAMTCCKLIVMMMPLMMTKSPLTSRPPGPTPTVIINVIDAKAKGIRTPVSSEIGSKEIELVGFATVLDAEILFPEG